jgi:spore coat protein H
MQNNTQAAARVGLAPRPGLVRGTQPSRNMYWRWSVTLGAVALMMLCGCSEDAATGTSADTMSQAPDAGGSDADAMSDAADIDPSPDTGPDAEPDTVEEVDRPADWTTQTHSNDVEPNIAEVFSDTEVKRIDIVFSAEEWASMIADMTEIYGEPGGRPGPPGQGFPDQNPIFVPADIVYNDREWPHVGVRFKGNSSLQSTWSSRNLKLSFKLDFDEFEGTFPEIENQRFYGIKKLSLKNNFDDPSFVREKVMADVFAEAGMVISHTAFYTVYVDRGEGAEYFGLYTMVEEVDGSVIKTQYDDSSGNLYKPDGTAAQLSDGSFDEDEIGKKNNEVEADFSDVLALLAALHDDARTSDPERWRQGLDAVFDTDVFLQYLAINGIGQNWDTYGLMTHNYYLYQAPDTGRLTWIPWDNNEALQAGKRGGALPLDFSGLRAATWPLIGFLYADPVYRAKYELYLQETIDGPFTVDAMHARYDAYEALIEPYATTERQGFTFLRSPAAFAAALVTLRTHAEDRVEATENYLNP